MKLKAVSGIMLTLLLIGMLTLAFNIHLVFAYPIPVPYHQQVNSVFCGPASLEMVFDFYGPDVSQYEIADAARAGYDWGTSLDDMRRAAHFSNLSFSVGSCMPETFEGYSSRTLGYAAFTKFEMTLDQLRYLINNHYPLIVATWYALDPPRYGHYRVVVDYTAFSITFHDPWYGLPYKGPNVSVINSEFLAMWELSANWGLFVSPWKVAISAPDSVYACSPFTLTATITYPCPDPFSPEEYPASSCNATLILPEELSIAPGETAKKTLGTSNLLPRNSATVSWVIQANAPGDFTLSVEAEGKVAGYVHELGQYPAYDYEDRIGGTGNCSISCMHSPDLNSDGIVDIVDITICALALWSQPGDPNWNPIVDQNNDGTIDIIDLVIIGVKFGETY